MKALRFEMPGAPQPKQRARVTARGTFTPKATRVYEKSVRDTAAHALRLLRMDSHAAWPMEGEYELDCRFYLPGFMRGDLDNLGKAIGDALQGVGYANDSAVSKMTLLRVYADPAPRTEVTLTWLGPKQVREKARKTKKATAV